MAQPSVTDIGWLSECLGRTVARVTLDEDDLDKLNNTSYMRFASVEFENGETTSLVLKVAKPAERSQSMGLAREAFFYNNWRDLKTAENASCEINASLPQVVYAQGSMGTGAKTILMQDLSDCVQSGYFFGPGSPMNWGKDLTAQQKGLSLSVEELTTMAFSTAAKLHAPYWECTALRNDPALSWMRGHGWIDGQGREEWEASQGRIHSLWMQARDTLEDSKVNWAPLLVECLDASVAKIAPGAGGWEAFQADLKTRPCTLVHGDFHPGNFMVCPPTDDGKHSLVLIDWEVVGLGSGPQDLGQFMISHTSPRVREQFERKAVTQYLQELKALNRSILMSEQECWAEYIAGGLGRWMWFLPLLNAMCPPSVQQYFCDQVLAFIKTHGITADTVPMPRA